MYTTAPIYTGATSFLQEVVRKIEAGFATEDRTKISVLMDLWLNSSRKIQESTRDFYKSVITRYVNPHVGQHLVQDLQATDIEKLLARLSKEKSERIAWSAHIVLRAALNYGVRQRIIPSNPCNAVEPPRRNQKKPQPLTRDQTIAFLNAAEGEALYPLFLLAVEAGLRSGELLGLKWIDIDERARMLSIRRQARVRKSDRDDGRKTLIELVERTKTGKGRSLLLTERSMTALKQHKVESLDRAHNNRHGLVFSRIDGEPMQRSTLNRTFRRILRRAGLPIIRFHDLRHTAATLLLLQGVHPKVAQERLGHTTIGMTLDLYSAWMPSMQDGAVTALDDMLGSCHGSEHGT